MKRLLITLAMTAGLLALLVGLRGPYARMAAEHLRRQLDSAPDKTAPLLLGQIAERDALLADALTRLPLAQREVVVLKQFVGLTFREIAESLDVPLGTVLGRMHRAVRKLAEAPELKRWMNA